jgi:hypothetical protein
VCNNSGWELVFFLSPFRIAPRGCIKRIGKYYRRVEPPLFFNIL